MIFVRYPVYLQPKLICAIQYRWALIRSSTKCIRSSWEEEKKINDSITSTVWLRPSWIRIPVHPSCIRGSWLCPPGNGGVPRALVFVASLLGAEESATMVAKPFATSTMLRNFMAKAVVLSWKSLAASHLAWEPCFRPVLAHVKFSSVLKDFVRGFCYRKLELAYFAHESLFTPGVQTAQAPWSLCSRLRCGVWSHSRKILIWFREGDWGLRWRRSAFEQSWCGRRSWQIRLGVATGIRHE